jgi:putative nucleotidyltransferase with HDIG domain
MLKKEIEKYLNPGFFFLEVLKDKNIKDREDRHPEIGVFNHSLQVFYLLSKRTGDLDLLTAGLFHDIGKTFNTLQHDKIGAKLLYEYYPEKVIWLVKNHIRIIHYLNGEMRKGKRQVFERHNYFGLLKVLRECDIEGRKPDFHIEYDKEEIVSILEKAIINRYNKKNHKG